MARAAEKKQVEQQDEMLERLVGVNRVAKVVKGGRRFGFAALMVVGDGNGRVGTGHSKSKEVPDAIQKATQKARQDMLRVPLREGRTLHHDVYGRSGAGKVFLRSAPPGTGIIAGGPLRAIFEVLGIQDVVAKTIGSNNPYNMVNATLDALSKTQSPRMIANRRNKKVGAIVSTRTNKTDKAEETAEK